MDMKEKIEIWEELCKGFSHPEKEDFAKSAKILECVNKDNIKLLKDNGINIKYARFISVLALEHDVLENRIKFYLTNPELFEAIKELPVRLLIPKDVVSQRIGICDRINFPYRDEKGKIKGLIFDSQKFNDEVWLKLTPEQKQIFEGYVDDKKEAPSHEEGKVEVNESSVNQNNVGTNDNLDDLKECALHVLEQFALTDQKDLIFQKLDELKNSDLSKKEKLMEAMKSLGDNTELLASTIDEVLSNDEDGRVLVK